MSSPSPHSTIQPATSAVRTSSFDTMQWEHLISDRRFGLEQYRSHHGTRTDFQRDYDRLIFSAPFRRLQNKTQVFPLPGTIFVHNRLTHSLEVSCIGRSLGTQIGKELLDRHGELPFDHADLGAIVSAACIAHDMGNPPFGHAGERAITAYFREGAGQRWRDQVEAEGGRWSDFEAFEGNANALRLLTHTFEGRRAGGFVLTYSTLASIVKYPYSSLHPGRAKFGFFATEQESYTRIAEHLGLIQYREADSGLPLFARHPLVYLVEAADDICYQIMDLEDAYKLRIISRSECQELMTAFLSPSQSQSVAKVLQRVTDENEQIAYLRSACIGNLVDGAISAFMEQEQQILRGELQQSLIGLLPQQLRDAYAAVRRVAFERIYFAKEVLDIEFAGYRIFEFLLDSLIEAQIHPDRGYSKLWFGRIPSQYDMQQPTLYGKIQSALDYVSGMTDVYALDLYRKLTGISLPGI